MVIDQKDQKSRHLSDILSIIESSALSSPVKDKSSRIFTRLADAEAKVHGTTPDKIHFHEVGAVDSIVDNVGAVIGLELLGVTHVMASAINVGSGTVKTAHGMLPIPAPATAELLAGIPFYQSSTPFELTTPTGAVIISTLGSSFGPLPPMKVDRIAYGAGDKEFPGLPNVLRLMIGQPIAGYDEDTSIVIETNIDDMSPQVYGYLIDKLMQQGAHDVYLTPIIMKKGRPAILLSVLTDRSKTDIRAQHPVPGNDQHRRPDQGSGEEETLREMREVETPYGKIGIKISRHGDEILTVTPEYEDCRRIAEEKADTA